MASIDLAELLEVCVRATLAAQRYVMLDLIKLPEVEAKLSYRQGNANTATTGTAAPHPQTVLDLSQADRELLLATLRGAVTVDVKSHLDYKEGDAAEDLVTTADVLTQAVLTHVLERTFPTQPFTVVGEEEEPSSTIAADAQACVTKHYDSEVNVPFGAELRAHVQGGGAASTVCADSVEALRRRVGVFIDPIDGTNCFFSGVWQAPMTLVGITLDDVPVAGVLNRVFYYPLSPPAGEESSHTKAEGCVASLSYVYNTPGLASPFVVFDGALLPAPVAMASHPPCTAASELRVCRSSTTKDAFLQQLLDRLTPYEAISARGAGYKQYHLLKRMWTGSAVRSEAITPADVFVCPPSTIKKWDCCAAHAFLYAMGGDIFSHDGAALRYALVRADGSAGTHTELAALPKGLVAVTPYAKEEVGRRMGWAE